MRKHLLWIVLGCLLLLLPINIRAEETSSPQEVIVAEEETPQAGGKRYSQSLTLWIVLGCLLLLLPINIRAEETSSPQEVIVAEEETPQAGGKRYSQSLTLSMVGLITLVGIGGYVGYWKHQLGIGGYVGYWKHQQNKPHLAVTNVTDNGDGSFVVNVGFNVPLKETTTFHNADINVSKGCAIILKKINKCELEPSESKDVFVTIVNKDTLKETTTFHNADINVSKGCAIILKKINKCELEPSESKDVFVTIVNKDTQLKCQLDNQVIDIDGMEIMKGVKHE